MNANTWLVTRSGRKFNPFNLQPFDVCIEDIAFHLAGFNRYFGGTRYTVAEHLVRCSWVVSAPAALLTLVHDTPEVYTGLGDIAKPVKQMVSVWDGKRYISVNEFEDRILEVIFVSLGIKGDVVTDYHLWTEVEHADEMLLATEVRDLFPAFSSSIWGVDGLPTNPERIEPWPSAVAERMFLERYHKLAKEVASTKRASSV